MLIALVLVGSCTKKQTEEDDGDGGGGPVGLDLWDGVPELVPEPDDIASTLAPKAGPERPPQIGEEIELPFPPDAPPSQAGSSTPEEGPLAVLRFGPTGEQGLVDAIRVSFNHPMVPLSTVEKLRTLEAPLVITPRPPGKFRWMGTRTVAFFPEGRMPYSTEYTVEVPADVASTGGSRLGEQVRWKFSTPILALASATPHDGAGDVTLDSLIKLEFNQPIRSGELSSKLSLQSSGGAKGSVEFDVVPESGWVDLPGGDPMAGREDWQRQRMLILRPRGKLTPDTRYTVKIPAGVYGEGDRKSPAISTSFSTYPPLRLTKARCGSEDCSASYGIFVDSTTALADPEIERKVRVDPPVEDLQVVGQYRGISLSGKFLGDTKYTIEVDEGLRDTHGQTLAKPFKGTVRLGPLTQQLSLFSRPRNPAVIESSAARKLDLRVSGLDDLEVMGRGVSADEIGKFLEHGYSWNENWAWPEALPEFSFDEVLDVKASRREVQRVPVELSRYLDGGHDFVYLNIRSNEYERYGWKDRSGLRQIVQVTDMSISAALDGDDGALLVTGLASGQPLEGVDVRLYDRYGRVEIWKGRTDADGLARPEYEGRLQNEGLVIARYAGRSAFLTLNNSDLRGQWIQSYRDEESPRVFFYTDRQPYKPGDTVHLSGILRKEIAKPEGSVQKWRTNFSADYTVTTPRGIEVAKGQVKIGPFGTFSVDIPTKEEGDTGSYRFEMIVKQLFGRDHYFSHHFAVEEYRTPEFEVEVARTESAPLLFGDKLEAEIKGSYLHGAPMVGAEVSYNLQRSETSFRPPGSENDAFTFGQGGGRWRWWHGGAPDWGQQFLKQEQGTLDETGRFVVTHALAAVEPLASGEAPKQTEERPPRAATYKVNATITDENRQAIAGSASFVVHPALSYVGVRAEKSVLREGERAKIEAIVTDLTGARETGKTIELEVLRKETSRRAVEENGHWTWKYETDEQPVGSCELVSGAAPVTCEVDVQRSGTHVARAKILDEKGRKNASELELYVHGKDAIVWDDEQRRIDIVPDKRSYEPGEKATLLVRSPFERARGFLVVEREGIERLISLNVDGGAATIELPIAEHMLPGVTVSALLVSGRVAVPGAPPGQDLGMPGWATGEVGLEVSTDRKKVFVELTPNAEEIAPKDTLTLQVQTKDHTGRPLSSHVAIMVVDEGVLSLMGYQTPDPLGFFHHQRWRGVGLYSLHQNLLPRDELADEANSEEQKNKQQAQTELDGFIGHGGGGGTGAGYGGSFGEGGLGLRGEMEEEKADMPAAPPAEPAPVTKSAAKPRPKRKKGGKGLYAMKGPKDRDAQPIMPGQAMAHEVSLRTLFATTAFFDADVQTDFLGRATVEIPMPENLTTFRVMAVAIDPNQFDRFGNAETSVRVRKPIMLRPSLPRFANLGDRFEASVMVDNQTEDAQTILVGTRGLNVSLPGETEKGIEVPAGESREVRFDMAVEQVGKMRLQFAALSNGGRDATEVSLPVLLPATKQAFADYGMTDASVRRKVDMPADVLPGFGGLEVSMSSTALNGLEDAVQYLVTYPYECAEQTASRILPIFALGKILDDFPIATTRDRIKRDAFANQGILRLLDRQVYDGGFGFWDKRESWPYLSTWVTFALLEGKQAGYTVDPDALGRSLNYLDGFVQHGYESRWGRYYDWTTRAFALWLLSREDRGAEHFDLIWAEREKVPLYARAMLMSAAHRYKRTEERDEILAELREAAVENARTVHFAESRSEAAADGLRLLMHSDVQTDSIVMMALLEVSPDDPIIPKVMAGIMSERDPREGGRWRTTHANAWALVAASRYYQTIEKETPDYIARIWLDADFAGEHAFTGRSMAKINQQVPMSELVGKGERELTLAKEGPGKLYYRLGMRYAPASLELAAEDQGFTTYRHYEPIPEPDGSVDEEAVTQLDDGNWRIKAGANVKVTVTLVVHDRANYVVVDDPFPAGFEGQNPRFLTSVGATSQQSRSSGRHDYRFGHDTARGWWWPWWSFDHTQMRDDRMLLFADHLSAGVYTYTYTARATTIGEFILPPTHAEAMYEPERFGHSSSSRVSVVE